MKWRDRAVAAFDFRYLAYHIILLCGSWRSAEAKYTTFQSEASWHLYSAGPKSAFNEAFNELYTYFGV